MQLLELIAYFILEKEEWDKDEAKRAAGGSPARAAIKPFGAPE